MRMKHRTLCKKIRNLLVIGEPEERSIRIDPGDVPLNCVQDSQGIERWIGEPNQLGVSKCRRPLAVNAIATNPGDYVVMRVNDMDRVHIGPHCYR